MFFIRLIILLFALSSLVTLGMKVWNNPYATKITKRLFIVFFIIAGLTLTYMLVVALFTGSNF
jgi:hypothetical protein